jgi:NifU-like protein involved in Fe-S cluster formation
VSVLLQDYAIHVLARETAKRVKQFYENPKNVQKFEEWRKKNVLETQKNTHAYNNK